MPILKSYNSTVLFFLCENSFAHFDCSLIWIWPVSFGDDVVRYDFIQIGNQSSKEFVRCDNLLTFDDKQMVHFICTILTCTSRSFIFASLYLYALFHFSFVSLIKRLVYQDVTRSFRSYSFETNHHPWNARFLSQWFELHRCGYCGDVRDIEKFSFLFSNNFRYFMIVRGLN